MEEFEYKGLWWMPGLKSSDGIPGTLTFSEKTGVYLDLVGTLQDPRNTIGRKSVDVLPVILGLTNNGNEITLVNSFQAETSIGSAGFPTERYRAQVAVKGKHFDTPAEIIFDDLTVEYQHLREWTGMKGLSYSATQGPPKGFEYSYRLPASVNFTVPAIW